MGRVLGRVEYADGAPDHFFIHDDTTGWSIPPLYADPHEAWQIYEQGGVEGLVAARPQRDTVVRVIRKVLSRSSSFPPSGRFTGSQCLGLRRPIASWYRSVADRSTIQAIRCSRSMASVTWRKTSTVGSPGSTTSRCVLTGGSGAIAIDALVLTRYSVSPLIFARTASTRCSRRCETNRKSRLSVRRLSARVAKARKIGEE